MLHTIETRKVSGYGSVETEYEIRTYERFTDNGVFIGGKTIKTVKQKKTAENILRRRGLRYLGTPIKSVDVWAPETLWGGETAE